MTGHSLAIVQGTRLPIEAMGIYTITCVATGKVYVGHSGTILERIAGHKAHLRHGNHHNRYLQEEFDRYGEDSFVYTIREIHSDIEAAKAAEGALIGLYADKAVSYNMVLSGRTLPRSIESGLGRIAAVIHRIRAYRRTYNIPRSRLAELAGVWENAIRNMDDESWNPTYRTLAKLEALIPSDYEAEEKAVAA
jgi:hypothetical protein